MSRAPFFKLFFSDLVGDTLHLTNAEMGSYFLLLGAMWNAGGPLENDTARLARMARCSPKVWPRMWSAIGPFFIVDEAGVTSPRLLFERQKVDSITQERRNLGALGAKAKALKNKERALANGSAKGIANAKQPEPDSISISPLQGRDTYTGEPSNALPLGRLTLDGSILEDAPTQRLPPPPIKPIPEAQDEAA